MKADFTPYALLNKRLRKGADSGDDCARGSFMLKMRIHVWDIGKESCETS